jgi:hypothetical protein
VVHHHPAAPKSWAQATGVAHSYTHTYTYTHHRDGSGHRVTIHTPCLATPPRIGPDAVRRYQDARPLQALCFSAQARTRCGITKTRALCRRRASLHRSGYSAASPRRAHSAGAMLFCAGPDTVQRHQDTRTLQALCFSAQARTQCSVTETRALCRRRASLRRPGRSAASPRRAHSTGAVSTTQVRTQCGVTETRALCRSASHRVLAQASALPLS